MKHIIIALMSLSIIAGCSTTQTVVRPTFQETNVPETILVCPKIRKSDFPPVDATNAQVHAFIKKMWEKNMVCAGNMEAVKSWLAKHNAAIRETNKKIAK